MKIQKRLFQGNEIVTDEIPDTNLICIEFIDNDGNVFQVDCRNNVLSIHVDGKLLVEPVASNSILIRGW